MSRLIETATELFHQAMALLTELLHRLSTLLAELFHQTKTLLTELFHYLSTLLAELFHHPSTSIERLTELLHQEYSQYLAWYQGADNLTQYLLLAVMAGTLFLLWVFFYLTRLTK